MIQKKRYMKLIGAIGSLISIGNVQFVIGEMNETPTNNWLDKIETYAPVFLASAVASGIGYIVYNNVDSNSTLLQKVDEKLQNIDLCKDVWPPLDWQGTLEDYFEHYLFKKHGIVVTHIHKGYKINDNFMDNYFQSMMQNLHRMLSEVWVRSFIFSSMSDKIKEIESARSTLFQAKNIINLYTKFLQMHQILNFYAQLSNHPTLWLPTTSDKLKQKELLKLMRSGYYAKNAFPIIANVNEFQHCLTSIQSCMLDLDQKQFPKLIRQLEHCYDILNITLDFVCNSQLFKDEKDQKYRHDQLLTERAKSNALQAQAEAQRLQAWEQSRLARAQEEANQIARRKK